MRRRPPGPPLFPYATLFRSRSRGGHRAAGAGVEDARVGARRAAQLRPGQPGERQGAEHEPEVARVRSEEHTSELQSPCNLVCRLLLEKKKTQQIDYHLLQKN